MVANQSLDLCDWALTYFTLLQNWAGFHLASDTGNGLVLTSKSSNI